MPYTRNHLVAATGVLALTATGVVLAPPASAFTTINCSSGSVALTTDDANYVLRGRCSEVVVSADNVTVRMRDVGFLKIRGANNAISARDVETLIVAGVGGNSLDLESARVLEIKSADQSVEVTGRIGRAFVLGQDHTLRATRFRKLAVRGDGSVVRIVGGGNRAVIKGSHNTLRSKRLRRLSIVGSHNAARVYRGTTKVRVLGTDNVVRVNPGG